MDDLYWWMILDDGSEYPILYPEGHRLIPVIKQYLLDGLDKLESITTKDDGTCIVPISKIHHLSLSTPETREKEELKSWD